ncbi:MAG TPA: ComEC/Rec2 family competence protein, partial [Candidatus Limnocylindrales bacterium]|nr:ComEC/Rec2 family competence protein [Candidatus Limnocylindrales bacterium]
NFRPIALILLAAAGTALVNPLYLWSDLGWYLSFLAFYGVMVLGPLVRYQLLPERFRESTIILIIVESLCAEVMALPLILYIFGQTSLVGLVSNVLIAAVVPLAMLLAVIAGLAGMLIAPLAGWIAWPAVVVLTYMLDVAHLLATIPHVFVENLYISLAGMILLYSIVLFMNLVLYSRLKRDRAILTLVQDEHTLLHATSTGMSSQYLQLARSRA